MKALLILAFLIGTDSSLTLSCQGIMTWFFPKNSIFSAMTAHMKQFSFFCITLLETAGYSTMIGWLFPQPA